MKKIVLMLLLVASYATMMAQAPKVVLNDKDGWHKIGETKVNFKQETDKITILGANRFAALKIKVKDAPILLDSFDIYFDNDEKQTVPVGQEFKVEGETKVVDFGGEKNVKRVEFRYKTVGKFSDDRGSVTLWGLKTNPGK